MKKAFLLILLLAYNLSLYAFNYRSEWDDDYIMNYDSKGALIWICIICGLFIFSFIVYGIFLIVDYCKKSPDERKEVWEAWRLRRYWKKRIKKRFIFVVKADTIVCGWRNVNLKDILLTKGEKCYIVDAPGEKGQPGYLGIEMVNTEKYKKRLSIHISFLEEENKENTLEKIIPLYNSSHSYSFP